MAYTIWRFSWFIFLLLLLGSTLACRQPELPALPPEEIVQRTAARMSELDGFHFVIDRSGAPAYLDPGETLVFRRAEGGYVAPDRARATVRVIAPGLVTEVSVISVGPVQWQTNVLTGAWEELPPHWGFNPTILFDASLGLQAVLAADLSNLALVGVERLESGPDTSLYRLTADATGERLYQMSGGLMGPQDMTVELWIAPETFELHRAVITEPVAGEVSIWQVDFTNFDQVVVIDPPG